ncbi:hypothetical protein [Yoonia sp. 208BN28-4]|uniref:hypothetical protein n=1 Tax=Yoonia sp. 208BN28-4 TaxID=3126505 RepID=UPI00309EE27E
MSYLSGPYRTATLMTALSGVLYIAMIVVGGVSLPTLALVGVGLLFVMLAGGLSRARRSVAWLAFFVTALGAIYALAQIWSVSFVPAWYWQITAVAQAVACLSLFVPLWKATPAPA